MPNWVSNTLKLENAEDFASFKAKFINDICDEENQEQKEVFSFNSIIPEPATRAECDKKYVLEDKSSWFNRLDWHWDFWGVKWDAEYTSFSDEDSSIFFDTAWCEPIKVYEKLAFDGWNFSFSAVCIEGDWEREGYAKDGKITFTKEKCSIDFEDA